jgi:hypothetical protein
MMTPREVAARARMEAALRNERIGYLLEVRYEGPSRG